MKVKTSKTRSVTLVVGERLNGPGYPRRRWRTLIDGISHERWSPSCSHFGQYEKRRSRYEPCLVDKKVSKWIAQIESILSDSTVCACHSIVKGELLGVVVIHLL